MLESIKNFKPQVSTNNFIVFFSIPYLITLIINTITFILSYYNLYIFIEVFLIISTFLNCLAFVFDILLFNWVFKIIATIPGVNDQVIGHGIYLGGFSLLSLIIATIFIIINTHYNNKIIIKI